MHVERIEDAPVHRLRFLNAGRGGRVESQILAIQRGRASGLPTDLAALVLTGDLQGVVRSPRGDAEQLLGVAVAEVLTELAAEGTLPPADRTGVILAGDLYSVPGARKRGGHGDVTDVWSAFADRFAWVAGVLGNHDDLAGDAGAALQARPNLHVLDGSAVERGGVRLAGVSYVAGDPGKPGRRDLADQLALIDLAIDEGLDVLVLHEGPAGDADQLGHAEIRARIERGRVPLTVCGHVHWPRPLATHARGQIVNVDSRVIVLVPG
ncbi:MAG: metallophosphoesterase [Deltaproteobacteria bacterium]|nr:metallophosphoesterase [Deltaproteobacteria bacterium]